MALCTCKQVIKDMLTATCRVEEELVTEKKPKTKQKDMCFIAKHGDYYAALQQEKKTFITQALLSKTSSLSDGYVKYQKGKGKRGWGVGNLITK